MLVRIINYNNFFVFHNFKTLFYAVIFLTCLVSWRSEAYDFYKDCVKGYQFSDHDTDPIELTPLNKICVDRCKSECNAFSRKVGTTEEANDSGNSGEELNQDVIDNCMTECKGGNIFTSTYYEEEPRNSISDPIKKILMPPASTAAACTEPVEYVKSSVVRTAFKVAAGDLFGVFLSGKEERNKIYLCGEKTVNLSPVFPNINSKDFDIKDGAKWNNNTPPQGEWEKKSDHRCFQNLTDEQWNKMTNYKLWSTYINDPNYGECSWNARNKNFVNTKIPAADGDELTLEWSGDYSHWDYGRFGRQEFMECLHYETNEQARNHCRTGFSQQTSIVIKSPLQSNFNYSAPSANYVFPGEEVRPPDHYFGIHKSEEEGEKEHYKKNGLTGRFIDFDVVTEFRSDICDENKPEDYERPECIRVIDFGTTKYTFSGILSDFSSSRTELGVSHFDIGSSSYRNNLGGLDLTIRWGGCPFFHGQRTQYAIFHENDEYGEYDSPYSNIPEIPEESWKDVPQEVLISGKYIEVKPEEKGRLFLRIKSLAADSDSSAMQDLYNDPKNYSGQYYVIVERQKGSDVKVEGGPITTLVNTVKETMLGKDREFGQVVEGGVVYNIYDKIVSDQRFINTARAVVLLYITFLGIGFILGISSINQRDLLIKLIKVSLIITMISPTSWDFFGGYLVPLCVDGVIEVMGQFLAGSYPMSESGYLEEEILSNPEYVFELFDGPLQQMFSSAVWKKIVAILFSGLPGFILAVTIVISIFYYCLTIIKATMMYLVSIISMSLLIISAPVFLLTSLFSTTRDMFTQWCKLLISFTLQPIMVMVMFAMFNILLTSLMQTALSFTACPGCFLYVDIVIYKACWIPYYYPVIDAHLPPGVGTSAFGSPTNLGIVLAFLIVANGAYVLSSYIVLVVSSMVTGSYLRATTIAGPTKEGFMVARSFASKTSYYASSAFKGITGLGASVKRGNLGGGSNIASSAANIQKRGKIKESSNESRKRR